MGCVHHWIIDPPEGPTSAGVCARCGESRQFRNSPPSWDGYRGRAQGAGELSPQEKKLAKGTSSRDATKVGAPGTHSTVRLGRLDRRV